MGDSERSEVHAIHTWIARVFDGPETNQGEEREAASTARAVLVFSLATTACYVIYFLATDVTGLRPAILTNIGFALVYGLGLVLVRVGKALAAAVLTLTSAISHILITTWFLGSPVGFHVLLLVIGQVVFMVFTDAQQVYRWFFFGIAAVVFAYCQFALNPDYSLLALPSSAPRYLFSLNAAGTGLLLTLLAAVAHSRGRVSAADANRAASRARFLANTDPLTGLANRRPVADELERVSASGDYCVVVADLDNFKELNDRHGHLCGDQVLAAVGETLHRHVRDNDTVGRWGGEEFIFVLPGTAIEDATGFAERLRVAVEACAVECAGHTHRVTASFGVADGVNDGMSHRVVRRADDAMYEAKEEGRNRVRTKPLSSVTIEPPTGSVPTFRGDRRRPRA